MIALLMNADILINLTDIDGLYNKDPRVHSDAELIPFVATIKRDIEKFASGIPGTLGTGGMLTKIKAARKVNTAGIPMIIAKGSEPDILFRLFAGEELGTFFIPKKQKMANRKCWIGFGVKPKGIIRIDDGAVKAILEGGKSLLPIGITDVEGEFGVGSPVEFKNGTGDILGTGLVNYKSSDIRKIMGLKTDQIKEKLGEKPYDEVIHRDNLTITGECSE
jgi:glutamate 5-kinase